MADKDLKSATPDTSLPTDGFLFGADSQSATDPSIYPVSAVGTTLLGSTALTGATVTTSQPVLNLTQTWNAGAVTFTGLKFNATDTASASGSLLLDLQVGGASRFAITKAGNINTSGSLTISSGAVIFLANSTIIGNNTASGTGVGTQFFGSGIGATLSLGSYCLGFTGGNINTTPDTILTRAAAATLQLGAADVSSGAVAQTLQVQSNTGAATTGPNFTIKGSAGTTAGGSIIFQTHNGTAYATALTIASNRAATFASDVTSGNDLLSARWVRDTSASYLLRGEGIITNSGGYFAFASGSNVIGNSPDVLLYRDAANTLALRNGTNAQTFNIYNTYTDAANYEKLTLTFGSNDAFIQAVSAGTGTQRNIQLVTGAQNVIIRNSNLTFFTDNTNDIGASGANRPRRLYVAGGSLTGSAADSSIEISPTWNTSGTPTAIKLNVTNTASASGSFLMSLQTGGTNQFAVRADNGACFIGVPTSDLNNYTLLTLSNDLYINSKSVTAGGIRMCHGTYEFAYFKAIGTTGARLQLGANTPFGWTDNAAAASGTFDTILSRAGVATLQLGAADVSSGNAVAQFLRVQSTTAASQTAPNFTIQGSRGTTAGGSIIFQTAATSTYTTALTLTPAQKAEFAATIKTAAPAGGTAAEWKLGTVATVSPTSPNRTIEVEIGGTTYYLHAKTTND